MTNEMETEKLIVDSEYRVNSPEIIKAGRKTPSKFSSFNFSSGASTTMFCFTLLRCLTAVLYALVVPSVAAERSVKRSSACTVKSSNGKADDSPAIKAAFEKCANGGTVTFSEGVDYNAFTPISATNLKDVTIEMYGNLHLPQNITYMQEIYNKTTTSSNDNLFWFNLAGPGIHFVGTSNITTGWIYSYGQIWWDANPANGTGLNGRPNLMSFNTTDGSMKHFKSRKPIAWGIQLVGSNITITDTIVDAYSVSGSFPFNTDGFDVTATDVTITNSVIYNGDDAIAIQSGSSNILFQTATIGYQSHGMSIGSLGETQTEFARVSNIQFDDVSVINAVYGARFKSWLGGQGLATNITWSNIRVYNVTFPIFVTQTYYNQGSSQTQSGSGPTQGRLNNATVNMRDFRWTNWTGTINEFMPGDGSCTSDVSTSNGS